MSDDFALAMDRIRKLPRSLLADAVREDQDRRWATGAGVPAEAYFAALPALGADPESPAVIIYGEAVCREAAGEAFAPAEYLRRFPNHASRLVPIFEVHAGLAAVSTDEPNGIRPERSSPALPGLIGLTEVGRGAMGTVYSAVDSATGTDVAVKVVGRANSSAESLVRFRQECEILSRLDHPNIVRLLRWGATGDHLFLVMEWVAGGTLAARCGYPIAPEAAAQMVATLADAVALAHERGVIHRDLKPANVLMTPEGLPKLADFGVARLVAAGRTCTATGQVLGTPSYMAPEQVQGQPEAIGVSVDVYGLGAILYELLSGHPPFVGKRSVEILGRVLADRPAAPPVLSERSSPVWRTCLRCLEKHPQDRFPTAQSLARELRHARD